MNDLKAVYETLGFQGVITFIQSGNVIFKSDSTLQQKKLVLSIEKAISKKYGFEVPVIIRNIKDLAALIKTNPFVKNKEINPDKLHVTFLSELPAAESLENLIKIQYPPDEFIISGKEIFLFCPGSYGETKLSNKFFENKLKVSATTRNWKTVNKLFELAQAL
jgi:uncharacterized protein (DUF1697 family)